MVKRVCLITCTFLLVLSSFSQSRRKSKSSQNPKSLIFADSAEIKRYSDSIKHAAYLADTLSDQEASDGLKELLIIAANNTTEKVSVNDGFYQNSLIKIGTPPEDQKSERGLRNLGYNKQVDDAIANINHTAEDACKLASPLIVDLIKNTDFANAKQLLKSSDTAGTIYFKQSANASLNSSLRPIVVASMEKTASTKYWTTAFNTVNKFGLNKSTTDLATYITDKTVTGLMLQMAKEEQSYRNDPKTKESTLFKKLYKK